MWSEVWGSVTEAFTSALRFLHDLVASVPFLEGAAWGWAIVLLTVIVRVLMLPLAIKQTRSMRAMQKLQPQIKELQRKYKVDRSLMKKDPEQYRAKRQKLNEEMMALYQREGANPAASCLPLLAQAPIFIALFWTLRDAAALRGAGFYFFTAVGDGGLEMVVRDAGWPGWLLIVLMSGTMFWSQKQMMARNSAQTADNPMAQQQKIMLYVMPVFLAVISLQFPLGILLYWVTTNMWQGLQQFIILREVKHDLEGEAPESAPSGPSKGATSGRTGGSAPGGERRDDGGGRGGSRESKTTGDGAGIADRVRRRSRGGRRRGGEDGSGDGTGGRAASGGNGRRPPQEHGSSNGEGQGGRRRRGHLPRRGDHQEEA